MSDLTAPSAFELVRRAPSQRTAGLISGMTGYRETARGRFSQRETASLVVPLIISFGTPFLIALGREPDAADRQPSFAAGLYAGPVLIESDGGAECVQVDFTPLGAYRFFGSAVVDLAARMVDMSATCWAAKAGNCASGLARRPFGKTASIWSRILLLIAPTICRRPRSHSHIDGWRDLGRRADYGAGEGDRLESQAPGEPFSIRTRSRAEAGCPHHAFPSSLPARTCGRSARLGRDCGRERLCRSGASRPRIFNPCRRAANGLGPTAGADRQPSGAIAGRLETATGFVSLNLGPLNDIAEIPSATARMRRVLMYSCASSTWLRIGP